MGYSNFWKGLLCYTDWVILTWWVQKSHSQPPNMYMKPVKNGINKNQLPQLVFTLNFWLPSTGVCSQYISPCFFRSPRYRWSAGSLHPFENGAGCQVWLGLRVTFEDVLIWWSRWVINGLGMKSLGSLNERDPSQSLMWKSVVLVGFWVVWWFFLLQIGVRTTFDQFYGIPFPFCNRCFKQLLQQIDYEVTKMPMDFRKFHRNWPVTLILFWISQEHFFQIGP